MCSEVYERDRDLISKVGYNIDTHLKNEIANSRVNMGLGITSSVV